MTFRRFILIAVFLLAFLLLLWAIHLATTTHVHSRDAKVSRVGPTADLKFEIFSDLRT
jgi:multidrug resistance efflux pump